jgi:hypothetical protein
LVPAVKLHCLGSIEMALTQFGQEADLILGRVKSVEGQKRGRMIISIASVSRMRKKSLLSAPHYSAEKCRKEEETGYCTDLCTCISFSL